VPRVICGARANCATPRCSKTPTPEIGIDRHVPSGLAVRLVPERVARRHRVVPLRVDNRTLTYATNRPLDADADRDLSVASGRRPTPLLATRSSLLEALDRCYPKLRELDVLAERLRREGSRVEEADPTPAAPVESTVIELCNSLLGRAIEVGASDVHIECTHQGQRFASALAACSSQC
jgi:type IV pilus assembly protein PilB